MSETHTQLVIFMPTCDHCGLALVPSSFGWLHAYHKKGMPHVSHPDYFAMHAAWEKAWSKGSGHPPSCRMWAGISALTVWRELTDQSVDEFLLTYRFD